MGYSHDVLERGWRVERWSSASTRFQRSSRTGRSIEPFARCGEMPSRRALEGMVVEQSEGAAKQLDGVGESMKGKQGGYASGRAANSMNQWG